MTDSEDVARMQREKYVASKALADAVNYTASKIKARSEEETGEYRIPEFHYPHTRRLARALTVYRQVDPESCEEFIYVLKRALEESDIKKREKELDV